MSCKKYEERAGLTFHNKSTPGNQLIFYTENELWGAYKKDCINLQQFMRLLEWFHQCKANIVVIDLDHGCIKASST